MKNNFSKLFFTSDKTVLKMQSREKNVVLFILKENYKKRKKKLFRLLARSM
jgi:hypothetical protein